MKTIKALEAWEEIEREAHHARMRGEIERADILETAGLREFKRSLESKITIAIDEVHRGYMRRLLHPTEAEIEASWQRIKTELDRRMREEEYPHPREHKS